MFKILIIFFISSLIGFFTIWLKREPGNINIIWYGWQIESTVPVLAIILILVFLILSLTFTILKKMYFLPKTIKTNIHSNKNKKAMNAIINALSAKNMEEIELAKHFLKKTKILNNKPIKLILEMEINKFYNNFNPITFKEMLNHSETKLLGIKNLTNNYLKENDITKALDTIKLIPKSKNTPNWFFYKLLQLNILNKDWDSILLSVKYISKYTNISSKDFNILQGRIHLYQAKNLFEENNKQDAMKAIETSLKFIPSFSSTIILKSKIIYDQNPKQAIEFIKASWKKYSHPDLISFIYEINSNKNNNYKLKFIKDITKNGGNHFNNTILLAKAAIDAKAWSTARQALNSISEDNWTKNMYIMMAEIEEKQNGNKKSSNKWMNKSNIAPLDFSWGCTNCTYIAKEWKIICPKCLSLDSIKWQQFKSNINTTNSNTKVLHNRKTLDTENTANIRHEDAARGILEDLSKGINN